MNKSLQISNWDILHDRIWEVKWESNYKIAIYKFNKGTRYRLWFSPLWENSIKHNVDDLSFLWFRKENQKLVFSWMYVPPNRRSNWIWKIMFEVFLRIQDLLNLKCNETHKINKPNIAIFLNKIGFYWKEKGLQINVIGQTQDWIPIIDSLNEYQVCKGVKNHKFLVIGDKVSSENKIITNMYEVFSNLMTIVYYLNLEIMSAYHTKYNYINED